MRYFILISGMILALASSASGETYVVNPEGTGDFPTIQAAIDAVVDGDIIELTVGTFTGEGNRDLDYLRKAITIRGQVGIPSAHIIDCQGSQSEAHRGFRFVTGETPASVLEGVTVINAYVAFPNHGGGVECRGASPTISNCVFHDNAAPGRSGGALACRYGSSPNVINCTFVSNSAQIGGAIGGAGSPRFSDCRFTDNAAAAYGGAVGLWGSGNPTFTDCIFSGNWALAEGGGIWCIEAMPALIGCTFLRNQTENEGGAIWSTDAATFISCTFAENGAANRGSGIWIHGPLTLENTIIAFGEGGAAVHCLPYGATTVTCCDIFGNAGGDWVGCIADQYGINGNICEDPIFCGDLNPLLPYLLHGDSPCAPDYNPECGLIGAWPVGCGAPQVGEEHPGHPAAWNRAVLIRNTPNPFTLSTRISFSIPDESSSPVFLNVLDPTGRLIRTLVNMPQLAGLRSVSWDGADDAGKQVEAGIYFYRLSVGQDKLTRQMVLVK